MDIVNWCNDPKWTREHKPTHSDYIWHAYGLNASHPFSPEYWSTFRPFRNILCNAKKHSYSWASSACTKPCWWPGCRDFNKEMVPQTICIILNWRRSKAAAVSSSLVSESEAGKQKLFHFGPSTSQGTFCNIYAIPFLHSEFKAIGIEKFLLLYVQQ